MECKQQGIGCINFQPSQGAGVQYLNPLHEGAPKAHLLQDPKERWPKDPIKGLLHIHHEEQGRLLLALHYPIEDLPDIV